MADYTLIPPWSVNYPPSITLTHLVRKRSREYNDALKSLPKRPRPPDGMGYTKHPQSEVDRVVAETMLIQRLYVSIVGVTCDLSIIRDRYEYKISYLRNVISISKDTNEDEFGVLSLTPIHTLATLNK